ncbi:prolipoprotein diacylglyceryl transferase [Neolewinella lacunae]|uniref:Prolipoprotein diacylglyceryl transferase n=1 Tax=Neolewinella lacunae TaxID=1517758 RepID=A0A923PJ98_9BACT|nr:prolipoprotein diacylglyceryl transferase family protein [Neolewinella lacunae]MBC6995168.1 prolipoprotein diacylglyceryl transferase [Neolewinella lacunae]MDN3634118.1 prolipoprotein diacylglyceryl transferase [Neolewinella lacunae]
MLSLFPVPNAALLHLILETVGISLGYGLYQRLRAGRHDPLTDAQRLSLLIAAIFGALFGSRLLGGLEDPARFFAGGGELGWQYYFRAKTIVGGLLGGLAAVEIAKRWLGIRQRSGDLYVYPLLLAMVIGRVGCFLMGVGEATYGLPTTSWVGMDLGDGILRHPTALYEIVFLLLCGLGLWIVQRHWPLRSGRLFMLFMTSYLGYRLVIGFWQPGNSWLGLAPIQWACLLGLLWYVIDERNG